MSHPMSQQDLQIAKTTVLLFAVEALIATHPDPEGVRTVLDRLLSQFQADVLVTGAADPTASNYLGKIADGLFLSQTNS